MWVEWDDGSHLSRSRKKPGSYSSLTREDGTNDLGNVTLSPLDESEMDAPVGSIPLYSGATDDAASNSRAEERLTAEDIVELAILINRVIEVTERAAPHVKAFWNNRALPTIKSARSRIALPRRHRTEGDADPAELENAAVTFTVEQVWEDIRATVEANPSLADRKELAELEDFLAQRRSAGAVKRIKA